MLVLISSQFDPARTSVRNFVHPKRGHDPQIYVGIDTSNGRGALRGLAT
jgi:hypothetical protein